MFYVGLTFVIAHMCHRGWTAMLSHSFRRLPCWPSMRWQYWGRCTANCCVVVVAVTTRLASSSPVECVPTTLKGSFSTVPASTRPFCVRRCVVTSEVCVGQGGRYFLSHASVSTTTLHWLLCHHQPIHMSRVVLIRVWAGEDKESFRYS